MSYIMQTMKTTLKFIHSCIVFALHGPPLLPQKLGSLGLPKIQRFIVSRASSSGHNPKPDGRLDKVSKCFTPGDQNAGVQQGVEEGEEVTDDVESVPDPQVPFGKSQFEYQQSDGVSSVADDEEEGELKDCGSDLSVSIRGFVPDRGSIFKSVDLNSTADNSDDRGQEVGQSSAQ